MFNYFYKNRQYYGENVCMNEHVQSITTGTTAILIILKGYLD